MSLAHHLNELAQANSDGLLNDDEYRLLRQSLFDQHASTAVIPVETPLVPIAKVHVQLRSSSSTSASSSSSNQKSLRHSENPILPQATPRSKSTVSFGVANLLRRATGRKTPVHDTYDSLHIKTHTDSPKRTVLPRILHRKPSNITPIRTEPFPSTSATYPSPRSPRIAHIRSQDSSQLSPGPRTPLPASPSFFDDASVFDDGDFYTAADIRNAITATQAELLRLMDAFDDLESTTVARIHSKTAHRPPNLLLEGKEWRDPDRRRNPPQSPRRIDKSDSLSIRSVTSSLSQSRSSTSTKPPLASPLSLHFCTSSISIRRKNSISSVSSQGPASRLGSPSSFSVKGPSSLSRSTGHLPLTSVRETSSSSNNHAAPEDDAELIDVRRRREGVSARYTARLNYLRAKLKGAELHEKLMRK